MRGHTSECIFDRFQFVINIHFASCSCLCRYSFVRKDGIVERCENDSNAETMHRWMYRWPAGQFHSSRIHIGPSMTLAPRCPCFFSLNYLRETNGNRKRAIHRRPPTWWGVDWRVMDDVDCTRTEGRDRVVKKSREDNMRREMRDEEMRNETRDRNETREERRK